MFQEAAAPSILSSLMEEVGLEEEVAVLASTREKFRRMLRSMAEEGEVVAKELVQEEEDAVGLQEEVQELEQRLELRLRGGWLCLIFYLSNMFGILMIKAKRNNDLLDNPLIRRESVSVPTPVSQSVS